MENSLFFLCLKFVLFRLVVHDRLGHAIQNWKLVQQRSLQAEDALGDSLWWRINFLYSRKARCILASKIFALDTRNAAYFVAYFNYSVRLFPKFWILRAKKSPRYNNVYNK
jgi:hypothetical protein